MSPKFPLIDKAQIVLYNKNQECHMSDTFQYLSLEQVLADAR
jgi:hypothetical protein